MMQSIPLWENGAPGTLGNAPHDNPTLDIYESFGKTFADAAVVILPGGGYSMLSGQEGEGYAGFFQLWGFHSYVCNYRLGSNGYRHPIMLQDAARALRLVRSRAGMDGFNPNKIVLVGSSAGGHLAATLLTKWDHGNPEAQDPIDRVSSRPNLGVLCYPVITMLEKTHGGSRENLIGADCSEALQQELSAELHVNRDTPPCFVWHTLEDESVPVQNAMLFAQALHRNGVPFEFHCYERGGHGLGMKDGIRWTDALMEWIKSRLL